MFRRLFSSLFHFAAACLLLAGLLIGAECYLLHDEADQGRRSGDDVEANSAVVYSTAVHHTLRPRSVFTASGSGGGENRVVVNSFGLRGAEPAVPKPADLHRVLIMGDETIFARRLSEAETTSHQLQELLQQRTSRPVEVINAAVPGYCPLLSLLQFRHSLAGMHPDTIVLAFALNDPSDDRRYRPTLLVDRDGTSLSCSHGTLSGEAKPLSLGKLGQFAIGRWAARNMFENVTQADSLEDQRFAWLVDQSDADWRKRLNDSVAPINELARITRQLSVRLILTSAPVSEGLVDGSDEAFQVRTQAVRTSLREVASSAQIEFCDTSNTLSSQEMLTPDEPGLTALGHQSLAMELANHIRPLATSRRQAIRQVSAVRKMALPELD